MVKHMTQKKLQTGQKILLTRLKINSKVHKLACKYFVVYLFIWHHVEQNFNIYFTHYWSISILLTAGFSEINSDVLPTCQLDSMQVDTCPLAWYGYWLMLMGLFRNYAVVSSMMYLNFWYVKNLNIDL